MIKLKREVKNTVQLYASFTSLFSITFREFKLYQILLQNEFVALNSTCQQNVCKQL